MPFSGCDVLITTLPSLERLLRLKAVDLTEPRSLVLDGADHILSRERAFLVGEVVVTFASAKMDGKQVVATATEYNEGEKGRSTVSKNESLFDRTKIGSEQNLSKLGSDQSYYALRSKFSKWP